VLEEGRGPQTFGRSGPTSGGDDGTFILEVLSVCVERLGAERPALGRLFGDDAVMPGRSSDGMDSSRDLYGINVPKSPCVHRPLWKEEPSE
jgi:hypothetical protein